MWSRRRGNGRTPLPDGVPIAAQAERWAGWGKVVLGSLAALCVIVATGTVWVQGFAHTSEVEPRGTVVAHAALPAHSGAAAELAEQRAAIRELRVHVTYLSTAQRWQADKMLDILGALRIPVRELPPAPPITTGGVP